MGKMSEVGRVVRGREFRQEKHGEEDEEELLRDEGELVGMRKDWKLLREAGMGKIL